MGWVAQRRRARGRTMLLRLLKLSNIFVLHEDDSRYTEGAGGYGLGLPRRSGGLTQGYMWDSDCKRDRPK